LEIAMQMQPVSFVYAIISVIFLGPALAEDLELTRDAQSGVESRIAYARLWDRGCNSLPLVVTITRNPANGTASVVQGTSVIPASTPASGSTGTCAGKTITGNEIMYWSKPGYRGIDALSYDNVSGSGLRQSTTITINVK
jgi:hypothetical protein